MALWLGVSDGMKMKVIYAISGIYSYRQGLMPFLVPFFLPEHLQPRVEDDKAICILSAWHPWPYLPLTVSPLTSFKWGKAHFCVVQTTPGCVCCLLQLPASALSLSLSHCPDRSVPCTHWPIPARALPRTEDVVETSRVAEVSRGGLDDIKECLGRRKGCWVADQQWPLWGWLVNQPGNERRAR